MAGQLSVNARCYSLLRMRNGNSSIAILTASTNSSGFDEAGLVAWANIHKACVNCLRNSDDCDHPFRRIATSAARVQTTPLDDGGCDASRLVVGQAQ